MRYETRRLNWDTGSGWHTWRRPRHVLISQSTLAQWPIYELHWGFCMRGCDLGWAIQKAWKAGRRRPETGPLPLRGPAEARSLSGTLGKARSLSEARPRPAPSRGPWARPAPSRGPWARPAPSQRPGRGPLRLGDPGRGPLRLGDPGRGPLPLRGPAEARSLSGTLGEARSVSGTLGEARSLSEARPRPTPSRGPWARPAPSRGLWERPAPSQRPWSRHAPSQRPWSRPTPSRGPWPRPAPSRAVGGPGQGLLPPRGCGGRNCNVIVVFWCWQLRFSVLRILLLSSEGLGYLWRFHLVACAIYPWHMRTGVGWGGGFPTWPPIMLRTCWEPGRGCGQNAGEVQSSRYAPLTVS